MKMTKICKILSLLLGVAMFLSSCEKSSDKLSTQAPAEVKTDNLVLKALGVTHYAVYPQSETEITAKYVSEDVPREVSLSVDTMARIETYSFKSSKLTFKVKLNKFTGEVTFSDSQNDIYAMVVKDGKWVDVSNGEAIDIGWFKKFKFDYTHVYELFETFGDIKTKNIFKDPIAIQEKKVNDAILIKKTTTLHTSNLSTTGVPCKEGTTCHGDSKYDILQTSACESSRVTMAANCSNQYCIGYCRDLGCDCICSPIQVICQCTAVAYACKDPYE